MDDDQNSRNKNFDSTFDENELKNSRSIRRAELRKNKRAEAIYTKRNFQTSLIQESHLNEELTTLYLRSTELEIFIQGAESFAKMLQESYSNTFIDTCIDCLMSFPQHPDIDSNRGFISTSLIASVSNSPYSSLLAPWIPTLLSLIACSAQKVQENLYWILGNIALDSDKNRECILIEDFFTLSCSIINEPQSQILTKKICWCISHCCKGKFFENQLKCVPYLSLALKNNIMDIYPEVLWGLAHISDKRAEVINDIECLGSILKLIKIDLVYFQQPALRVIGNILSGNKEQVELLVSLGVIKYLSYSLEHKSKVVRHESMWALSNLCATKYVKDLVSKGIIKRIVDLSITDCPDVQNEAVWGLYNAIIISDVPLIKDLVDLGILSALCYLLNLVSNKEKMLLLRSLDKILKIGEEVPPNPYVEILESNGGKETIEHLLDNQNEKINKKSSQILNQYFENVSKDMDLVPTNNFAF